MKVKVKKRPASSLMKQAFVSDEFREWLSQHDPILSEMIYKGFNVSERRIDEAIKRYFSSEASVIHQ